MPLPDGPRLLSDVTVVDDGKPRPVLLIRTPYGHDFARAVHDPIVLARQGWAVVLQDVRGRWGSEGTFEPMQQEGPDGAAAIAWCARQPWSNGRVATIGASYQGVAQWAAALERPKGLCAISPSIAAPLPDGLFREGGAFRVGAWTRWALGIASQGTGGSRAAERRVAKTAEHWRDLARHPVNVDAIAIAMPEFREWIAGRGAHARPSRRLARIKLPGYHLAGWYDIFCEETIAGYSALADGARDERVRAAQRLVVGPWAHAAQFFQVTGEVDFGSEANAGARGIPQEQLSFLRDAVDGREPKGGVSVFVMGRNRWLDLDVWPPPAARDEPLFLAAEGESNSLRGGGLLQWAKPERSGVDRYRHDPRDPVPTRGGRHLIDGLPAAGPVDQRPLELRDDVLVYTSSPLESDLTVVGHVRARIRFASTAPSADVAVKLVDVHPDGSALNVVGSLRRVKLTPGKPEQVEVDAGSTAMTFRRRHRIRVELASSNWPHVDCVEAADQSVYWGGRSGSRLLLPVFEG